MWEGLENVGIERTLLKSIYVQPDNLIDITNVIGTTPLHFLDDNNRATFEVMLKLYEQGKEINEYNVLQLLTSKIGKVQATTHIVKIMSAIPTSKPVDVAYSVLDQSAKRRLYLLGDAIKKKAVSTDTHQDILSSLDAELREINQETTSQDSQSVAKLISDFYRSVQNHVNPLDLQTVTSGIKEFDVMLKGGFIGGHFIVIAARPSMGKTMLATQLAITMARADIPVAVFSLEMTRNELLLRLINQYAGRDVVGNREDLLANEEIMDVMFDLHSLPIHIDDNAKLDLVTLKAKARRLIKTEGVKAIVIDYLQLMIGPAHQSREREVAELSGGLKRLAKELQVPIICLSQLNRAVEMRQDKIPALSDLRESGAIEQDADVVIFIHRDQYYNEDAGDEAQIIFAKNRSAGLTGPIKMKYDKSCGLFE